MTPSLEHESSCHTYCCRVQGGLEGTRSRGARAFSPWKDRTHGR